MATLINRFDKNINGAITFIGNTLGLSKAAGSLTPGTQGSIGAFITTDNRLRAPSGWGFNTTLDCNLNSSSAILNIPDGSEIVYAELIWSAANRVSNYSVAPSKFVTFIDPSYMPHTIVADNSTLINHSFINGIPRSEAPAIPGEMYIRSAIVTDILKGSGNGQYICSGVNAVLEASNDSMQFAGWGIMVVYTNPMLPIRNIKLWIGDYDTLEDEENLEILAPKSGLVNARMAFMAAEGDAIYNDNNYLKIDNEIVNLSGPNNPVNNFFSSQINDDNGNLITSGPHGKKNHNPYTLSNVAGGKQGWDITNVEISNIIKNNMTTLTFGVGNNNGVFREQIFVPAIGIQVDLNVPEVTVITSVDKKYAAIEEILTYTNKITNNGDIQADNLVLNNCISKDTVFIEDSITIDGEVEKGLSYEEININSINPNSSIEVSYKVKVKSVPENNNIYCKGSFSYEFTPNDLVTPIRINKDMEDEKPQRLGIMSLSTQSFLQTNTQVNMGDLSTATKSVDRVFANNSKTLTYTLVIPNTGNVDVTNIIVVDTIPTGITFNSNSVAINRVTYTGYNPAPPNGFTLPITIPSGQTATVTFKVTTTTLPSTTVSNSATIIYKYTADPSVPNGVRSSMVTNSVSSRINDYLLLNKAWISYNFTVDPSVPNGISANNFSTQVNTQVNRALIYTTKTGDKAYANVNDILTYTIPVFNDGNVSAANVILKDTIPNGTSFVTNSLTLNGVTQTGANPNISFTVGTVPVGTTTIAYKVLVNTIPSTNPIENLASVAYNYTTDPSVPNGRSAGSQSNSFFTQVNTVFLNSIKTVNSIYADVGDTLTYTISLINTGNTTANNTIFKETIPSNTTFVTNSLVLNGVTLTGFNPNTNTSLGTLPIGYSTVTFKVIVNTIPSPNTISTAAVTTFNYTVNPSIPNSYSSSTNTNILNVTVNNANLSATETVDKSYAAIGDSLIYVIPIKNSGNVAASNVVIYHTPPTGITFIPNSVSRDSVPIVGIDPSLGANIGTIPTGTTTISFRVSIDTIPSPNSIVGRSLIIYNYTVDPSLPNDRVNNLNTNIVTTTINSPIITGIKEVDNIFANVGTTLTYTIRIVNTGNAVSSNTLFTDTIPDGTNFLTDSLLVNGVTQTGINMQSAFSLGTIPIGTTTVLFKVVTNTVPTINPTPNSANLTYKYTVYPSLPNGYSGSSNTNIVTTKVTNSILNPLKLVDKSNAKVSDTLNYTVKLYNIGNTTSNEVVFKDTIPVGTSYVADSFMLGGVTIANADLTNGINLDTLPIGITTVTFKLTVDTIPSINPISNACTVDYKYTVDPSIPNGVSRAMASDAVTTQVNFIRMEAKKYVNYNYADLGDDLLYTIAIKNSGNINATNFSLIDTIPTGVSFVSNSLSINGITQSGLNPGTGFNIATIPVGATTITYHVTVTTTPSNITLNPIANSLSATYSYSIDPTIPNQYSDSLNTEIVNTQANYSVINSAISVDKLYSDIGETITYTLVLTNNGNVDATNVYLIDTIPNGITFNSSVVETDNGTDSLTNPSFGVTLPTIPAGKIATVTFQGTIDTIPSINPISNSSITTYNYIVDPSLPSGKNAVSRSNIVYTKVSTVFLNSSKKVNKAYTNIGEELIYTIPMTNTGNALANNVSIIDTLPEGSSLVPNSIQLVTSGNSFANNIIVNYSYTVDPVNSIINSDSNISNTVTTNYNVAFNSLTNVNNGLNVTLNAIPVGVSTLTFRVKVNTIPSANPMVNSALTTYNYTVDLSIPSGASGVNNTNSINTMVNTVFLNTAKYVNKDYADVGDTLIYTIETINTGNTTANNVLFKDTIPVGTSFVTNSLTLNGATVTGANPASGFNIGTLPVGTSTVSFSVLVNTIPSVNPVANAAVTTYTYTSDPSIPNAYSASANTNIVNTQIETVFLNTKKYVNKAYANVGDTLVYTVQMANTGNTTANNVILLDTMPDGTSFITDSLALNGVTLTGQNPATGVSLGNISVGVSTVTFKVYVDTIPSTNYASNAAYTTYDYTVNPSTPNDHSSAVNTNIVNTRINAVFFNTTKTVDKTYANVGDTLIYTIAAANTGNTTINNAVIKDTIPVGTSFVTNSLKVNGVTQTGATINNGYTLGTLPVGTTTISFNVIVNTIPSVNPVLNEAITTYQYTVDPSLPNAMSSYAYTNTTSTQINTVFLNSKKYVDRAYANIGDILTYTIPLINTGNVDAHNGSFLDTIPGGTVFVADSLEINGVQQIGVNPQGGFSFGTIPVGATTISFKVVVDTIPTVNPTSNVALTTYSYTVNPANPNGYNSFANTNTVTTKINTVFLNAYKYVNKQFALVGDTLYYTIKLINTGNVTANNVFLTDTIAAGTSFVTNSLKVNSVTISGASPVLGYTIPSVAVGVTTVTFRVTINTIPSPNPILNEGYMSYSYSVDPSIPNAATGAIKTDTAHTDISERVITAIKYVDKAYANIGDTVTYITELHNNSVAQGTNAIFVDTIPKNTTFVTGSVYINSVNITGVTSVNSLQIGVLPVGTTTVSFSVVIDTIPSTNPIPNSSVISYNYTEISTVPNGASAGMISNSVTTQINTVLLNSKKTANKKYADVGEVITYTVPLFNTGNTTANNVVFTDTIIDGVTFVADSFKVNNVILPGQDPNLSITIGTIPVGTTTLTFDVLVNTIPTINPVTNSAITTYNYTVDPTNPNALSSYANTNVETTKINTVFLNAHKYVDKAYANVGDTLTYTVPIINTGNTAATTVVFKDTIGNGLTFVTNSLTLNGVTQTGSTVSPNSLLPNTISPFIALPSGFSIASIPVGVTTITFMVYVNTIPSINPIENEGIITYKYAVDPSIPNAKSGAIKTNLAQTQINTVFLNSKKYVDKAYANVGDTITYKIPLINTGNVEAHNGFFSDTIPGGTTFVTDSLEVNGVTQTGLTPQGGFVIGTLPVGATTVSFKVVIDTIPSINPVANSAITTYSYTVDPSNPDAYNSLANTNIITTKVNTVFLNAYKFVNKQFTLVGDNLAYTIRIVNTGNIAANNVFLVDTLATGVSFVTNSLKVNTITKTGANPVLGYTIPSVPVGVTTVTFNVTVNTIPSPNPILNEGYMNYSYSVDPSIPNTATGAIKTDIAHTDISERVVTSIKYVDKPYANIGDKLTYNIELHNTSVVEATNTVLVDTIPKNTTFVPDSIYVDSVNLVGVTSLNSLQLGTIPVGTTTVSFSVIVDTIPSTNPIPNLSVISYKYTEISTIPNGASSGMTSNSVTTQINAVLLNSKKVANKKYADIGEVISYTIPLVNTGNTTANNAIFTDTIIDTLTFVTDSFKVNGVTLYNADPKIGVTLGTLPIGITTVTFNVAVNTIPSINIAENKAITTYSYTVDPANPNALTSFANTNTETTTINTVLLNSQKYVDKAYANIGDTLIYTIPIINTGNTPATTVVYKATIPNGTTFVTNSLTLNGVTQTGASPAPALGFSISSIPVGVTTLTFSVVVNTIPSVDPIENEGIISYKYTVDPSVPNAKSSVIKTNIARTKVNTVFLNSKKYVDRAYANVGEILTYTIPLINTGNVLATDVVLLESLPAGVSYVDNSLDIVGGPTLGGQSIQNSVAVQYSYYGDPSNTNLINGNITSNSVSTIVPEINYSSSSGVLNVAVGTIPVGITTISFKVLVDTIPSINPAVNKGFTSYNYTVDPSIPKAYSSYSDTNSVSTKINTVFLNSTKYVDKAYANVGDTLTYTVPLINTGNVSANNLIFKDTIPEGTSFVANSLKINSTTQTGINPNLGFVVGTVPIGVTTISFKVLVNTIPTINPIPNSAVSTYSYTVDPSVPNAYSSSANTNIVDTQINTVFLNSSKFVDKTEVDIGDTIVYTVELYNTGNITANNVIFKDTIPQGTSLVVDSLSVDGVSQVGANPNLGYPIGTIPVGTTTISYSILVNTIPSINPILNSALATYSYTVNPSIPNANNSSSNTNIVSTKVNTVLLNAKKIVNKRYANVGDILTYTIPLINTGNVTANNILLTDTIPEGTSFINGSVQVITNPIIFNVGESHTIPANELNITMQTIPVGITTVSFKVVVDTIPTINPLVNLGKITYNYTVTSTLPNDKSGVIYSNEAITEVRTVFLNSNKFVDKAYAKVGDTLHYTVPLINTGNISANNVIIKDTIPQGTSFVTNSLTLNGITQSSVNLNTGFNVGSVPVGITTITFNLKVDTIPSANPVLNSAATTYSYTVDPSLPNAYNSSANTNIISTQINTVFINSRKVVSADFADIGDILTYTIPIINTGNIVAKNAVFLDTTPDGTIFEADSLEVNGIVQSGENPNVGFNLGELPVGTTTLSYKVVVETIPTINPIPNAAVTTYQYTVDPSIVNEFSGSTNTNISTTKVNTVFLNSTKYVDKEYANINDVLTYVIPLINTGNVTANNATYIDTIQGGTSFVNNSFTVNGVVKSGANPSSVISLGTLPIGTTTLSFKVVVNTIPSTNPIQSLGTTTYKYTVNPSLPNGAGNFAKTNIKETQVNTVFLNSKIVVNKTYANIGDILTYNIPLINTGNVSADNTMFISTIPVGTSFISDSLKVNDVIKYSESPFPGYLLGTVPVGITTITFNLLVETIPSINPIPNAAVAIYDYTVSPTIPNEYHSSTNTNIVNTKVNSVLLNSNKFVNKEYANVGDTLIYTVRIVNTGNTTANNLIFLDTTPNNTTFLTNSLTVNGVSKPGENPTLGFVLGTTPVGVTTLSFEVVVDTIPSPNPIPNYSLITYDYTVDPSIPNEYSNFANTNTVNTKVNTVFLNVTKGVNRAFSNIANNITYSLYLENTGNVSANNVSIIDTIPNGGYFVANSVVVNDIPDFSLDVDQGLFFNEIPVGTTTVSFKVYIDTIPSPNPMVNTALTSYSYTVDPSIPNEYNVVANSNEVETQITAALVSSRKTVDKSFADIGDTLTYNVILDNNGNTEVSFVVFKDTIPSDTTLVSNSFIVNGATINNADPSAGVDVGTIPVGTSTISFKVKVDTIPAINPITNNASVAYKYTTDPSIPNGSDGGSNSNSITTQVNSVLLNASKTVDKEYAKIGENISYTIAINNTGNITANNTIIKDTIPWGISFVVGSTKVNGNTVALANPTVGYNMGTLPIGVTTLTYSVLVDTIPTINPVPSESYIKYKYTVNPSHPNQLSSEIRTNTVNTQINDIFLNTTKTVSKAFAKEGDTLVYTISMINTGNISANNVVLVDTIPSGTTFSVDSLTRNEDALTGINLNGGLTLGTIPVGTTTIQFNVLVDTIPTVNPISNSVLATYDYTVNPSIPNGYSSVTRSNAAITKINTVFLNSKKYVSKDYADIGDTLVYTVALFNTGNVTANNSMFIDTIPEGTTFNLGSLKVNGITVTSANPNTGYLLGTVPVGTTTISYSVVVNTIPSVDPIPNAAAIAYFFTVDPSLPNAYSNSSNTNIVNTKVNTIFLNVNKVVSERYANIRDILTYDIALINTGNILANNVVVINTIPNGTTFVSNSVNVDANSFDTGAINSLNSNVLNITMQTIPIGVTTVSFKVLVDTIPSFNPIINGAKVSFNYTVDPSVPNEKSKVSYANNAITEVNTVFLNTKKSVDKRYADVYETLIYTIPLYNTGNVPAENVVIFDTIPGDTSFITDSLTINGIPQIGLDPNNGANIGTIPVGTTTIAFKVKVDTIPAINPILNSTAITYDYTVDPSLPRAYSSSANTNTVDTKVSTVFLNSSKTVSKAYENLKEMLTYSIFLTNTGNTTANNVVLRDTIPGGMTFVTNSLILDTITQTGANPVSGFRIGTIPIGTMTVTFKISADSIPSPNPMANKAQSTYSYTVDPSLPNAIRNSATTNDAVTNITAAIVNSTKTLNKNYTDIGETISYTVLLKNTGNVDVAEAVFIETIPNGISYVSDSFKVNNIISVGANPSNGVFIGTIPIGTTTLTFDVYVDTIPSINPVINSASTSFKYTTDPSLPNGSLGGTNTNDTNYRVNTVFLNTDKTVSKAYAKVGDTLIYTINLRNTGSVSANNTVFRDTIPNGTSFITNSLVVNGVTVTGINPGIGYNMGTIPIGVVTLSYKVNVDTIPVINPAVGSSITSFNYTVDPSIPNSKSSISYTNEVSTQINTIFLNSRKIVDRKYANQLDEVTYTVVLFNTGNIVGSNVVVQDTVPQGTFFVQDSLMINGDTQYGINPTGGVNVGTVPIGTTTVSFRIKIDGIPSPNPVENYAITNYKYTVDPSIPNEYSEKINSNTVSTMVYYADLRKSYKTVDKPYATCNDIVTYTIVVPNDGNIVAKNLVLQDTIPAGTSYIPNTLKVNGIAISGNPTRINVGNISPGAKSTIEFKIKINCIIQK